MHINGIEAGTMKGRRHFNLAIHALLPQNRDLRTHTGGDQGRSHIRTDIKADNRLNTPVSHIQQSVEFLPGAVRIITQGLHPVRCLGPGALQINAGFGQGQLPVDRDFNPVVPVR